MHVQVCVDALYVGEGLRQKEATQGWTGVRLLRRHGRTARRAGSGSGSGSNSGGRGSTQTGQGTFCGKLQHKRQGKTAQGLAAGTTNLPLLSAAAAAAAAHRRTLTHSCAHTSRVRSWMNSVRTVMLHTVSGGGSGRVNCEHEWCRCCCCCRRRELPLGASPSPVLCRPASIPPLSPSTPAPLPPHFVNST